MDNKPDNSNKPERENENIPVGNMLLLATFMGGVSLLMSKSENQFASSLKADMQMAADTRSTRQYSLEKESAKVSDDTKQKCLGVLRECLAELKVTENCKYFIKTDLAKYTAKYIKDKVRVNLDYPEQACLVDAANKVDGCEYQQLKCLSK